MPWFNQNFETTGHQIQVVVEAYECSKHIKILFQEKKKKRTLNIFGIQWFEFDTSIIEV